MSSDRQRRAVREWERGRREQARADRMPPPWERTRLQRATWPLMPGEVLVILLVVAIPCALALVLAV